MAKDSTCNTGDRKDNLEDKTTFYSTTFFIASLLYNTSTRETWKR